MCVETCSSGLLFWATLTGTAATETHGAALTLSNLVWAGSCNSTSITRNQLATVEGGGGGGGGNGGTCAGTCADSSRGYRQKGRRLELDDE